MKLTLNHRPLPGSTAAGCQNRLTWNPLKAGSRLRARTRLWKLFWLVTLLSWNVARRQMWGGTEVRRQSGHALLVKHLAWSTHISHTRTRTHAAEMGKWCGKWDSGLSLHNHPFTHLDVRTYSNWTFFTPECCTSHTHGASSRSELGNFTLYIGRHYWKRRNTSIL